MHIVSYGRWVAYIWRHFNLAGNQGLEMKGETTRKDIINVGKTNIPLFFSMGMHEKGRRRWCPWIRACRCRHVRMSWQQINYVQSSKYVHRGQNPTVYDVRSLILFDPILVVLTSDQACLIKTASNHLIWWKIANFKSIYTTYFLIFL